MKKIILLLIALISSTLVMNAQHIADNAIGLRLGDSDAFGAEVSYQTSISDNNRLEFGLGWRDSNKFSAVRVVGIYQWVWQLDGSFNWYAGVGGGLASYSFDDNTVLNDEISVFIAGDIGIEYDFGIPLLISLDFRPEHSFAKFHDDLNTNKNTFDIALGLRYQF